VTGMLMDASPIDLKRYPDFPDYVKNNKPTLQQINIIYDNTI